MRIDFLSIFPDMFSGFLGEGMMRIAREKAAAEFFCHDLRDWSGNRNRKIDDKPFGGGPGMVMRAEPVVSAVEDIRKLATPEGKLIFLSPQGRPFDQKAARRLAAEDRLIMVCGRYEGFDERIREYLKPEEISIGDYILTGGELPAMVVADSVVRLLPGVLGSPESLEAESFETGVLDFPHYTQPAEWRGMTVPEVLRNGNHGLIAEWRKEQALEKTKRNRPDLLE